MAVEAGGIGARLRAGRETHGLTVLQVAERIHTDPKLVEAIEAENFESLGAPVYARGHIRHYAELVGESGSELVALYSDLSRIAEPDLTRIVKAPVSSDSSKLVAPALLMIAVFAVAGSIWWVSSLSKKKPQLSETHVVGEEAPGSTATSGAVPPPTEAGAPIPEQTTLPQASEQTSGQAAPGPGLTAPPAQGARQTTAAGQSPGQVAGGTPPRSSGRTNAGHAVGQSAGSAAGGGAPTQPRSATGSSALVAGRPAPVDSAATQPRAVAGGSALTARAGATGSTPTPLPPAPAVAATPAVTLPARHQAQVTLRYSADSWTEVYDAAGTRLFYDVGAANSVQTLVGTPPLRVVLGNASGVAVEFNGQNKPIAKLSQPDGSVQFSINRSGQVVRAKPVADGG